MPELSCDVTTDGASHVILAIRGEIDMETAPQLASLLLEHGGTNITVDLTGVTFLDSTGISVLVRAFKTLRAAGYTLRTSNERDNVLMVLETTGLIRLLHGDDPPMTD